MLPHPRPPSRRSGHAVSRALTSSAGKVRAPPSPRSGEGVAEGDGWVWGAGIRRSRLRDDGHAVRPLVQNADHAQGVMRVISRRDGRAAAFPSVLAQVRAGAASEHDEGGEACFGARCGIIRSTDTAFVGKRDRPLFRGLCLSCAKNRRRSGRPHARDGGCEDKGFREGCMVSTRGISRSSISRRARHRRTADRHRAHSCGAARDMNSCSKKRGRWGQQRVRKARMRETFAATFVQTD